MGVEYDAGAKRARQADGDLKVDGLWRCKMCIRDSSVLSAVAEIERENIRTQTMAGREQKAREGKLNGGFAPYGYKLENGNLVIAEDEVEVIRVIYDRYIHTNEGVAGLSLIHISAAKKLLWRSQVPDQASTPAGMRYIPS